VSNFESALAFLYSQQKKRKAVIAISEFSACGYPSHSDVKLLVAKLIEEGYVRPSCSLTPTSFMFLGLSAKGEDIAKNLEEFSASTTVQTTSLSTELNFLIEKIEESDIRYKNKVISLLKENKNEPETIIKVFSSILQRPEECKELIFDIGSILMKLKSSY